MLLTDCFLSRNLMPLSCNQKFYAIYKVADLAPSGTGAIVINSKESASVSRYILLMVIIRLTYWGLKCFLEQLF